MRGIACEAVPDNGIINTSAYGSLHLNIQAPALAAARKQGEDDESDDNEDFSAAPPSRKQGEEVGSTSRLVFLTSNFLLLCFSRNQTMKRPFLARPRLRHQSPGRVPQCPFF